MRYPRIGETVDQFVHNWEVSHGFSDGASDMLPHRDLKNQLYIWSDKFDGAPLADATGSGRRIDPYGNIIHDEQTVVPFTPGPPAAPAPPPSYSQASIQPNLSPIFSVYSPPYQAPTPKPPPVFQPGLPAQPPSVQQPPVVNPPIPPPPVIPQPPIVNPPVPPPPVIPQPPFVNPPVVTPQPPIVMQPPWFPPPIFTPPQTPIIQTQRPYFPAPTTSPAPADTTSSPAPTDTTPTGRTKTQELGVTLLMLAPAVLPFAYDYAKKRAWL
jgi:hypothetical protein